MQKLFLWLADLILVTHTLFVLYIIFGFVLIWVGCFRKWNFVGNFYFRIAHLLAMGFVAVQTHLGEDCPLTIWENKLRIKGGASPSYDETFIGHWLGKILFYELGEKTFAVLYTLFFVLIVATFVLVKPRWPKRRCRSDSLR